MQGVEDDGLVAIKGFNDRGHLTIQKHDPQTYEGKPMVKLVGEPAVIAPASGVLAMLSAGARSVAVAGSGPAA